MNGTSGLHQSLATMGFIELALAFVALACYALVLNSSLGAAGRTLSAAVAAVAACGFTAMTEPWMNGVSLVAIGVAGLGLFVAAVWGISIACRMAARAMDEAPEALAADEAAELPAPGELGPDAAAAVASAAHPLSGSQPHQA